MMAFVLLEYAAGIVFFGLILHAIFERDHG